MILVTTNRPFLRMGRHRCYQIHYECNTSRTNLFSKIVVRIRLDAHIRTIVVLTGVKLTGFYFLYLLFAFYYSVTMHLRQGKNVSILLPGDVNLKSVPSRQCLLEDSPYDAVGATCLSCD
jgi:hypothetical protein